LLLVALKRSLGPDPRSFRLKRRQLNRQRAIVVVNQLRGLHVADQPRPPDLTFDVRLVPDYLNNRYPLTRPVLLLKDVGRSDLVPGDRREIPLVILDDFELLSLIREFVVPPDMPVLQHDQTALLVGDLVILGDPDLVLRDPRLVVLAKPSLDKRHRVRVGPVVLEFLPRNQFGDKPVL